MKIIFFGTPDFAVPVLEKLIFSSHEVTTVISQPDRPKGRSQETGPTPIKKAATKASIPVLQPEKCADPAFIEEYKKIPADINIIVAFGQIMPDSLIYHPKHATINIHASLLPKYRGASPINWALINGDAETGITYQFIEKRLDAGDIIYQEKTGIEDTDDAVTLFEKLSKLSADTVLKVLDMVEAGKFTRVKQDESKATIVKTLKKEDGKLDFNMPSKSIVNLVRGLVPWPVAYYSLDSKVLKIYEASVVPLPEVSMSSVPGTILSGVKGKGFIVRSGDGAVLVTKVQPESGKKMGAWDFYNGQKNIIGKKLQ